MNNENKYVITIEVNGTEKELSKFKERLEKAIKEIADDIIKDKNANLSTTD